MVCTAKEFQKDSGIAMAKTVEDKVIAVIRAIPSIMTEAAQEISEDFAAYIDAQMQQSKIAPFSFNSSDRLFSNSPVGGLADSFRTDSKVSVSGSGVTGTLQSEKPYANIHNVGGFIASKGNMHRYFWAQYAKTKQQFFKIIALSVIKNGGVTIRKRAYFDNAIADFQERGIPRISADIIARVKQIYEAAE